MAVAARLTEFQLPAVPSPPAYEMAIVERSFHAAYKGLEAIVGGKAPRDDEKLRRRLRKAGIDPDGNVVIPGGRNESMTARFRHSESVRNTLAAHGGNTGTERSLTYYNLIEVQWVLASAIDDHGTALAADGLPVSDPARRGPGPPQP